MEIRITIDAQKEFDKLPTIIKIRVRNIFIRLQRWPRISGYKALTGIFAGYYRLRTGDYRIIFSCRLTLIIIHRIGHRDKVYKKPI